MTQKNNNGMPNTSTSPAGMNRRQALGAGGLALVGAGAGASAGLGGLAHGAPSPAPSGTGVDVVVEDVTNVSFTLSPAGKMLAMDLLGILWTVPVAGGAATRLTGDFDDLGQPDWSPDGKTIIFQSYRSGNFHIWSIPATGGALTQLTSGLHDNREPRWSPDGQTIAFSSDRAGGRYGIYLLDVASGAVRPFSTGKGQDSEPCWTRDGKAIAYVTDNVAITLAPLDGGPTQTLASVPPSADRFNPSELHAPSFAPDGTLHYVTLTKAGMTLMRGGKPLVSGQDTYPFRAGFLADGTMLYGANGKIRTLAPGGAAGVVPFTAHAPVTRPLYKKKTRDFSTTTPRPVKGIVGPQLSPDGKRIVFGALNDIWLMTIGQTPKRLIADPFYKVDPCWSPDGQAIAFATDRGGTMDIWIHDIATGKDRQLTHVPELGLVSCIWSGDGKTIASLDQDGALYLIDVAGGAMRKLYDKLWEPGRPSFGPGGKTIAYAAFKPVSPRYREGLSEILTVDVATGKGTYAPIAPGKSLGVRGLDGPMWSPDGKHMAYVFASTLWVAPVDASGAFTGPPRQITHEVTDAPSWSGDSQSLLYLSNGALRMVSAAGGPARTIPCAIHWALAIPRTRKVIAAERMWDGKANAPMTGKEVVVEGNRIKAILPAGTLTDAHALRLGKRGQTLMPGLIDMHTHRQMQGYNYGDRMGRVWLAMGITATRSPGCPAYHMVEDREAIESGKRIAPRHYATGEAIDGGRIFYNFMRPVTEPGQMELELSRAHALDYDMVKTYVRLRHDVQKQVVDKAHAMGMHLSSHYHYPALHSGMDCMEHMGATNRYGYSRSITSVGGGYGDVNGLFAAAHGGRTSTLFVASALLHDDDALARDRRITTLFPKWEYDKLMARVHAMKEGDPAPLLASLERQVAQIKQTMARGWHILAGTDAPIDLVAISLHLNLRGMVRYGVAPVDALRAATAHAGAFLNEPIGTIAPGMLADLLLVDGNPLTHIEDAANVVATLCGGEVHRPDALMAPFARPVAHAPRNAMAPTRLAHQDYYWQSHAYVDTARASCCADHWHGAHA